MSISHYSKTTPFLSDLNGASLDQLRGKDTRALADLQQTLGRLNIRGVPVATPGAGCQRLVREPDPKRA